jgi:flagellar motor switch protein FliN/FliY
MENQNSKRAARIFASAFATSLATALTAAVKSPARFEVLEDSQAPARQEQSVCFRLRVEGALRGDCFVEFSQAQVADIGAKILGQPPAGFREDHGEALRKVISSAMSELATALSDQYGEFGVKIELAKDVESGGMLVLSLSAAVGEQPAIPLSLYFDGILLEAMAVEKKSKPVVESAAFPIDSVNLKLVMDVELNVSLRFGQRQLPLREVLELASGSVIELDRQVDEPVELLLDGKVIARGEAVIVDGNYGLRVTEVPQPIASQLGY